MKRKYNINDLDCAACSVKIEKAINEFDEIEQCTLDFINKKLYVTTVDDWQDDKLIEFLEKIIHIFESEVTLNIDNNTQQDSKKTNFNFFKSNYFELLKIIIAITLTVISSFVSMASWINLSFYIVAYLIVAYGVIIKTLKKIKSKNFFDENLLMTVASIGALIIGSYLEGVMVMVLYNLGEMFQSFAVEKSRKNIKEMLSLKVSYATLIKNGEEHQCKPEKLKIGDQIIVKKGERICIDGIIVAGSGYIDTSMLTGESKPIKISEGSAVLGGCINTGNALIIKVTKKFDQSAVAKIMELVELASASKPKSEKFITKFARIYTPIVMACALIVAFIPPIFTGDIVGWIYKALTFLVLSCPCAIVISVPLTFFSGLGVCAKRGLLVKGANVLENIADVDTVVFDKTGTLTKGVFEVQKIHVTENVDKDMFIKFLCYAESTSNHPIAKSIMPLYKGKIFASKINSCQEISGKGIIANIENKDVVVGSREFLIQHKIDIPQITECGTIIYMALNGLYSGYVVISDSIKPNIKNSLQKLKKCGVNNFVMLTGDDLDTANAVANQLGICKVYAGLMPEDKLDILKQVMADAKGKVMYVGDGINDAPVLMASDVGVSMGKNGSDIAIESGDLVLMQDDIMTLSGAFKLSKKTIRISIENIVFALVAKCAILILGIFGISALWMAVLADVGVSFVAILNATRMLYLNKK